MAKKVVLIVGVTGQGGLHLAELLLGGSYEVYGIKRQAPFLVRIASIRLTRTSTKNRRFVLCHGKMTDAIANINLDEAAAGRLLGKTLFTPSWSITSDIV